MLSQRTPRPGSESGTSRGPLLLLPTSTFPVQGRVLHTMFHVKPHISNLYLLNVSLQRSTHVVSAPPWQSNSCSVLQARSSRIARHHSPFPCRFPCHYEQCHPRNAVAKHLQLSTSRAHVHAAKPSGSRSTFRADSDGVWHGVAAKGAVFHVKHWTTSLLPLQARSSTVSPR